MHIIFDPAKDEANRAKHRVSLAMAETFIWHTAIVTVDQRLDYGEMRYIATGFVLERLHVLVFTIREDAYRVISLRKTNKRELNNYVTSIL